MSKRLFRKAICTILVGCAIYLAQPNATAECQHQFDDRAICRNCYFVCHHQSFTNCICDICGMVCEHNWIDEKCGICKASCTHEHHDPATRDCIECGAHVFHVYSSGRCKCGAEPQLCNGILSSFAYFGSAQQGTVDTVAIQMRDHETGTPITRYATVYLPYSYDAKGMYDVLVMVHGGGGTIHACTDGWNYIPYWNIESRMSDVYDYLISQEIIRPLIIVSPEASYTTIPGKTEVQQFACDLRTYLLPYICDHYATYADSGCIEDIQAEREHFGIGGISNGSLYALDSGMELNLDIFSNFIALSGNNRATEIAQAINAEKWRDLPINCFYAGAGESDGQRAATERGFHTIVSSTDKLVEGKNAFCIVIQRSEHDWQTWAGSMVNALQLIFPHE